MSLQPPTWKDPPRSSTTVIPNQRPTIPPLVYNSRVSYEEAFEAMKNGDFHAAVPLLEKAARDTGYTSDIINHAYTLALYHAGDKPRLADVAFRVANSLLQHDPASAMDYFQRALFAGLDASRVRRVGEIFEEWAVPAPPDVPGAAAGGAPGVGRVL